MIIIRQLKVQSIAVFSIYIFPILSYVNYDKISIHYAFLLNILLYCSYPPLLHFWIESTQLHATKYVTIQKAKSICKYGRFETKK
jgi:hypothetical protein